MCSLGREDDSMEVSVSVPMTARLSELVLLHSRKILLGVVSLLIILLVLPPIGVLIFSSFRSTADRLPFEATAFTGANYTKVFLSAVTYRLLLNTVGYAIGTVLLSM